MVSEIRTPRKYYGVSIANVLDIRNDMQSDKRVFTIYDTSIDEEEGLSHADVHSILSEAHCADLTTKGIKRIVRGRLHDYFSDVKTIA
jgi:hypothetical protein